MGGEMRPLIQLQRRGLSALARVVFVDGINLGTILGVFAFCGPLGVWHCHGQSKDHLVQALRDRETILQQFYVDYELTRYRARGDNESAPSRVNGEPFVGDLPKMIRYASRVMGYKTGEKWIVDVAANFDSRPTPTRERAAFDGVVYSQLEGTADRWNAGIISKGVITRNGVGVEEFVIGDRMPYSTAVDTFAERVELVDNLLRVTFVSRDESIGNQETTFRGRIWFDPVRGFAPVRQQLQAKREADWLDGPSWSIDAWTQDQSGVFLPKTIRRLTQESFTGDLNQGSAIGETATYDFLDWTIGPRHEQSEFRVAFPPATVVEDRRVGKVFAAVELTDWEILQEVESSAGFLPVRRYGVFLILGLAITLIGWFVFRRTVW
jgi:hypothetical protein